MKRALIFALLILLLLPALVSCAQMQNEENLVVTTVFPLYDFAKNLLGESYNVVLLLPPGSDLHSYEPTAKDLSAMEKAKVFLYVGGEGEQHVEKTLASLKNVNAHSFSSLLEDSHENHEGHHHTDEHIWTSPKKALSMIDLLETVLCEAFPEDAQNIHERKTAYAEHLKKLDCEYAEVAKSAPCLFFGDSFPFFHMAEDYGFTYLAAIDGCGEDSEPSASRVAELVTLAKENRARCIFHTERTDDRYAALIAAECSARVGRLHSCHNLSQAEWDEGETYLSLMQQNLQAIRTA